MNIIKRKHTIIFLILISLLISSISFASEALKSTFEKANKLYEEGKFQEAIKSYISIIDAGYENKDVYYNLGNSYFKLGKLGYAILCYEKAQKLAPRDKDIKHNLLFAQTQIVDRIELPEADAITSFYNAMLDYFTLNEITIILLGIFYIEITLIIIALFKKKSIIKRLALLFGAIFILNLIIFSVKFTSYHKESGVVLVEKLDVLTEPGTSSQIAFTVHEGTKLYIMEQRDEWYRVNLENRLHGWIKLPKDQRDNIFGLI